MKPRIVQLKASLEEQLTNLRKLDEEILRDLVGVEGVTDEEIADEVRVAGTLKGDINATIASLAELLRPKPPSTEQETHQSAGHDSNERACEAPKARSETVLWKNRGVVRVLGLL